MSMCTRPLVGLAALVIAIAACGGGASPAAPTAGSAAPAATDVPAGSAAPAATDVPATSDAPPTVTPTDDAAAGPDIGGAAAALADLDSYHLAITMSMQGLEDSMFSMFGDGLVMEGTVAFRPVKAADITMSMGPADEKLEIGYRLIGDQAWVSLGSGWIESPAEDAEQTIDSLAPDKMLGSFSGLTGLTPVGEETKNGVETIHYSASGEELGTMMASSLGLPGSEWTVDFWVAKDGGYAVSYAIVGEGSSGSFEMTLDVTDINSPANAVEPPPAGG